MTQISLTHIADCGTEDKPDVIPENAYDGAVDTDLYWAGNPNDDPPVVALTFDLGECYELDEICIAFLKSDERNTFFSIAVADDIDGIYSNILESLTSSIGPESDFECFPFPAGIIGQYVSIIGEGNSTGGTAQWVSIMEVEIFGTNAACNGSSETGSLIEQAWCDDGDCSNGEESWDPYTCDCIDDEDISDVIEGCTDPDYCEFDPSANCDDGSCQTPNSDASLCNTDCQAGDLEMWDTNLCACVFASTPVNGCTDSDYCEFDPSANCDDGSCLTLNTEANTCNVDCSLGDLEMWDTNLCACVFASTPVNGCTNPDYCEFDPNATCDDGSCLTLNTEANTCNTDCLNGDLEVWDSNLCACVFVSTPIYGCTDSQFCEYDPNATCDDGSCLSPNTEANFCNTDCLIGDLEVWDPTLCACVLASPTLSINGCTDPDYCEYNPSANCDDGSCMTLNSEANSCNTDCLTGDLEVWDESLCSCRVISTSILGCIDPDYCEYNSDATCDDGSCLTLNTEANSCNTDCLNGDLEVWDQNLCACIFASTPILGCTDSNYCEYNASATCDDGSCLTLNTEANSCNTDCLNGDLEVWDENLCACVFVSTPILGCTDSNYCEYNASATCDDGSCLTLNTEANSCNTDCLNGNLEEWDESLCACVVISTPILGCTDPNYCEYNASATCDDGSCLTLNTEANSCNTDCLNGDIEEWDESLCACVVISTPILGCTDPNYCEYDPTATCDDGSCLTLNIEANSCNTDCLNGDIEEWDESLCSCVVVSIPILGCTDPNYCEYDPTATCDDGSCNTLNALANSCNTNCLTGDLEEWDESLCSCIVVSTPILGCTDINSCNYDPLATCDNSSCIPAPSCNTDICVGDVEVIDPDNPCDCIVTEVQILGSTDPTACNYNPDANCDDGSFLPPPECNTDICLGDVELINPDDPCNCILIEEQVLGCTEFNAINYNSEANCDDGSCVINTQVFLPNILSTSSSYPNNSIVILSDGSITELRFAVYSRWGNKVSETTYETIESEVVLWNGQCFGEICEQGVYIYHLEYSLDGQTVTSTGDITLLR